VNAISQAIQGDPEADGRWTGYQKQFQGSLYRGTKPRELPAGFVPLPAERGGREGVAGEDGPEAARPVVIAGKGKPRGPQAKASENGKDKDEPAPVVRDLFSSR